MNAVFIAIKNLEDIARSHLISCHTITPIGIITGNEISTKLMKSLWLMSLCNVFHVKYTEMKIPCDRYIQLSFIVA